MASVLLVDNGTEIYDLVMKALPTEQTWSVEQLSEYAEAMEALAASQPEVVVVNADVARGWHLCTAIKKKFPHVPVVLLSSKATQDAFNNHQKLPGRADAYHMLPDELDRLDTTLSFYMTHGAELFDIVEDDEPDDEATSHQSQLAELLKTLKDENRSLKTKLKKRHAAYVRLHQTASSSQQRLGELETRLQAAESKPPPSQIEDELRARVETLEQQLTESRMAAVGMQAGLDPAIQALVKEKDGIVAKLAAAEHDKVAADARVVELEGKLQAETVRADEAETRIAAATSDAERLREQANAAESAHEEIKRRLEQLAAEKEEAEAAAAEAAAAEAAAQTKVDEAERAWSGVNARAEQTMTSLQTRIDEVERLVKEKAEVEVALTTSRRLMKDYGHEVARWKERVAEVERTLEADSSRYDELSAKAELVEQALKASQARVDELEESLQGRDKQIAELEQGRDEQIAELEQGRDKRIAELEQDRDKQIAELEQDRDKQIAELKQDRDKQVAELEQALEQAWQDSEQAATQVASLARQVASYVTLERAIPDITEAAEEYATGLRLKLDEANARAMQMAARVEEIGGLQVRLVEHTQVLMGALGELTVPSLNDLPPAPKAGDPPDFRALFETARAEAGVEQLSAPAVADDDAAASDANEGDEAAGDADDASDAGDADDATIEEAPQPEDGAEPAADDDDVAVVSTSDDEPAAKAEASG